MVSQWAVAPRWSPGLVVSLALGVCAGAVVIVLLVVRAAAPGDDSVEAGFARDMATHHAQAVEMAFEVRDKSSDVALRTLAYDIIVTQSAQRGVFMGWLQAWGLRQASTGPRMAWMPGHAHTGTSGAGGSVLMHGMATADEMQRLRMAQGIDAEVLFLQLMVRHHEGGVIMARAVSALSRRAEVLSAAKNIEESQRAEIAQMTEMLAARHAQPYRSLLE